MACTELTAFRVATESLTDDVNTLPRLGRAMFWRNMVPFSRFVTGEGVTRSTFTIKTSEPQDDTSLFTTETLTNGVLTACGRTWEDMGVGYYERTYSPKTRSFRGPVICKKNLVFQHAATKFVNEYVMQMQRYIARVWEFSLRRDYMNFVPWFVDVNGVITKYNGPGAQATTPRAFQGLTYDSMQAVAQSLILIGAGSEQNGYVDLGETGPTFPVEISLNESAEITRSNSTLRDDARYASMGKDGEGNFSLFARLGMTKVLGNCRHVPCEIPIRLDYTNGAYVVVSPFKDIASMDSTDDPLTDAYKNADFEAAIYMNPDVFEAEVVLPPTWPIRGLDGEPDPTSYNGTLEFIAGAERVCNPAEYDPLHEKGRHFGVISYAAAPNLINHGAVLVYKRCAKTTYQIYCS